MRELQGCSAHWQRQLAGEGTRCGGGGFSSLPVLGAEVQGEHPQCGLGVRPAAPCTQHRSRRTCWWHRARAPCPGGPSSARHHAGDSPSPSVNC